MTEIFICKKVKDYKESIKQYKEEKYVENKTSRHIRKKVLRKYKNSQTISKKRYQEKTKKYGKVEKLYVIKACISPVLDYLSMKNIKFLLQNCTIH